MNSSNENKKLVFSIKDRCRVCYTCVRECPVKAIKIINGQAEVMNERCIACGNCTRVCSQGAKAFLRNTDYVKELLLSGNKVAALVAPSFPAEFIDIQDYRIMVGMIRKLGFNYVNEVSFGADLVAKQYKKILENNYTRPFISSDCPAIVTCIQKYYPALIPYLAPIVSPMIAAHRVLKLKYGQDVKVVFIGPCIAKKSETQELDVVITFKELRELFIKNEITHQDVKPSDFDSPKSGKGAIFPIPRGLVQSTGIEDNLFSGNILVAEGKVDFQEALREFEEGLIESQHLELLCCEGCVMGAGISNSNKKYERITMVSNYVRQKMKDIKEKEWSTEIQQYSDLDLSRKFESKALSDHIPSSERIKEILQSMGKYEERDQLDCGACGYDSCKNHAIAIINGLAEEEMCLPFTIEKLHDSIENLAISNEKLDSIQQALKQSEKLAHMGQLSAGIAHELNNPLGVVIMYTNILLEECSVDSPIRKDLELIVEQSARCKKIVGGLLNFARKNHMNYEDTNVNDLIRISLDSLIIPKNIQVNVESNVKNAVFEVDSEQITQVITNLSKNAIEAMSEGGFLRIKMEDNPNEVVIIISDTGTGIKKEELNKIFEPFYTTKAIGKGTGLGLATTYGIVKMHKGKITVQSNADKEQGETGTSFKIIIPRNKMN